MGPILSWNGHYNVKHRFRHLLEKIQLSSFMKWCIKSCRIRVSECTLLCKTSISTFARKTTAVLFYHVKVSPTAQETGCPILWSDVSDPVLSQNWNRIIVKTQRLAGNFRWTILWTNGPDPVVSRNTATHIIMQSTYFDDICQRKQLSHFMNGWVRSCPIDKLECAL